MDIWMNGWMDGWDLDFVINTNNLCVPLFIKIQNNNNNNNNIKKISDLNKNRIDLLETRKYEKK